MIGKETTRVRKGGDLIEVSLTASPVYDKHAELIGVSLVARDITAAKKQAESMRQAQKLERVMSGEETLVRMRAVRPDIPVIVSSGFNEVEAVRRFGGNGLAGFIQKPYPATALAEKVKQVIESLNGYSSPSS